MYIYIYIYIYLYIFLKTYNNAALSRSEDVRTQEINARSKDTSYTHILILFNMHYYNFTLYRVLIY